MITAREALRLPSAQLTTDQKLIVTELLEEINMHVSKNMEYGGCQYRTKHCDPHAVAAASLSLRQLGWVVNVQPVYEPSPLNPKQPHHAGFLITLMPDEKSREPNDNSVPHSRPNE